MFQKWNELLFLHWEIDPDLIRNRLPKELHLDLHEGKAYLGIVPFYMQRIRPRFLPCVPKLSDFLELNVRTYVHDHQGRPGVWFFSLDCDQPIAVEIARKFFHLPYQHAEMSASQENGIIDYHCQRKGHPEKALYRYGPKNSDLKTSQPGTLEFFLLERYLLFSQRNNGTIYCGQVHHPPYQFTEATIPEFNTAPFSWESFLIEREPISALVSPGVSVEIFPLSKSPQKSQKAPKPQATFQPTAR